MRESVAELLAKSRALLEPQKPKSVWGNYKQVWYQILSSTLSASTMVYPSEHLFLPNSDTVCERMLYWNERPLDGKESASIALHSHAGKENCGQYRYCHMAFYRPVGQEVVPFNRIWSNLYAAINDSFASSSSPSRPESGNDNVFGGFQFRSLH